MSGARTSMVVALTLAGCVRTGSTVPPVPAAIPSQPAHTPGTIELAVTVDDLPVHGPLLTNVTRIDLAKVFIAAFRKHHLPPVFGFVNGRPATAEPGSKDVLALWTQAGNHLGNHTYSHVSLNAATLPDYFADLEKGEAILDLVEPAWRSQKVFRYPFLFEGNTSEKRQGVRDYLRAHTYVTAEVTVEADDWAFNPPFVRCAQQRNQVALERLHRRFVEVHLDELRSMRELTRVLAGRDVRQILLLHIGSADAGALDDLLTAYERAGVRWIPLPDALLDPFYAIDTGVPFPFGAAFPYVVAKARGIAAPPPMYNRDLERDLAQLCR